MNAKRVPRDATPKNDVPAPPPLNAPVPVPSPAPPSAGSAPSPATSSALAGMAGVERRVGRGRLRHLQVRLKLIDEVIERRRLERREFFFLHDGEFVGHGIGRGASRSKLVLRGEIEHQADVDHDGDGDSDQNQTVPARSGLALLVGPDPLELLLERPNLGVVSQGVSI